MPIANIKWGGQNYRINFDKKLTDTEVFDYMQKNYPLQPKQSDPQEETTPTQQPKKLTVKEFYNEQLSPLIDSFKEKALGTSRAITQGASAGQASHLSGITNELANLPQKVYKAKTINDIVNLYKDTGKDYVKGREQFKKEYSDFADKNKGLAMAGEILGGLATGGGAIKGITLSKKPLLDLIAKSGLSGGTLGALYGGSNTEGKGFDLKNAGVGAGIGTLAGGALPLGVAGVKGLGTLAKLYNKGVDEVAKKAVPFQKITTETDNVLNAIKQAENTATPIMNQAEEQTIKTTVKPFKNGKQTVEGDVISYIKNNGMQNKVVKLVRDNEAVRNEILKRQGDFGMRFGVYGDDAIKSIKGITPAIKEAEKKAYKEAFEKVGIKNGDEYFVKTNQEVVDDINNAINQYKSRASDEYAKGIVEIDAELGDNYRNLLNRDLINNGGIKFGKLKAITRTINQLKKSVARNDKKGKDSAEYEFLNSISRAFSKLKQQDAILSVPNNKFSKLQQAMERLEEEGGFRLDDKGAKQNAAKIFQNIRDRAGDTQETALDNFVDAISEFKDTAGLSAVKDKIQIAQASYGARDTIRDSKLSADIMKYSQNPKNLTNYFTTKLWNGQNLNNDEFLLMVANGLKTGKIKPKDLMTFARVKAPGMSDYDANRTYLLNKLFGIKAGGLKGIVFNALGGK